MNKQTKYKHGLLVSRGIEWCDFTWNPVGGCLHACRWTMPDGKIAICYAEETALGVARAASPQGFEHLYWHPEKLDEPLRMKAPARIFFDSMSELFGAWVSDYQINAVLDVCRRAPWHTFQSLTKNAPRLLKFDFPDNVWVGASMPPDQFMGQSLSRDQQTRMLGRALEVLAQVKARVRWMSFEPLSWDVSEIVAAHPPLQWAVIGAASAGATYYQPEPAHVGRLLAVLDDQRVPVFFKGNLLDWTPHRENFPSGEIQNEIP